MHMYLTLTNTTPLQLHCRFVGLIAGAHSAGLYPTNKETNGLSSNQIKTYLATCRMPTSSFVFCDLTAGFATQSFISYTEYSRQIIHYSVFQPSINLLPQNQGNVASITENMTGLFSTSTEADGMVLYSRVYTSFQRRFYGSRDPTNSVIALKDDGQSTRSRANPPGSAH